jgi:hypothetical protein
VRTVGHKRRSASRDQRVVGSRVEEFGELAVVGQAEPDHPALLIGFAVDQLGLAGKRRVRLGDLAAEGREEIADRLDRLDHAERRELLEGATDIGQLHEDDVTELIGGVRGDPDGGHVAIDPNPLVILGVVQIGRYHRAQACLL